MLCDQPLSDLEAQFEALVERFRAAHQGDEAAQRMARLHVVRTPEGRRLHNAIGYARARETGEVWCVEPLTMRGTGGEAA